MGSSNQSRHAIIVFPDRLPAFDEASDAVLKIPWSRVPGFNLTLAEGVLPSNLSFSDTPAGAGKLPGLATRSNLTADVNKRQSNKMIRMGPLG